MKQILMTLLPFFFGSRNNNPGQNLNGLVEGVKENIRAEVSALIFKALIGFVIAATSVLALLQFGRDLQIIFSQYQYGLYLEIVTFGIVGIGGCVLLFLLFKPPQRIVVVPEPEHGIDIQGLFSRFSEGLVKGYQSGMSPTENPRHLQTDF